MSDAHEDTDMGDGQSFLNQTNDAGSQNQELKEYIVTKGFYTRQQCHYHENHCR